MDAHWENEDWAEVAAYVDAELSRVYQIQNPLGILAATEQEMEVTRDGAGGSYVQIKGTVGRQRYDGPAQWEPQQQNDMRPRQVDRAAVKRARKVSRVNRRKRGRK